MHFQSDDIPNKKASLSFVFSEKFLSDSCKPAPIKAAHVRLCWLLTILISIFVAKWNLMTAGKWCPFLKCLSYQTPMSSFLSHARLNWPAVYSHPLYHLGCGWCFYFPCRDCFFPWTGQQNYCYELCLGKEFGVLFFLVIIC